MTGRTTAHLSISLDGFVAGPDQSRENPLGIGGLLLHHWHFDADKPGHEMDAPVRDHIVRPEIGAYVMGRNMYGPIRGEWDEDWRGWWGDDPPYHAPVYVLTHYAHEPIEMLGGTTFHFVTDGIAAALEQAHAAAGDADVDIAGGASAVRQTLTAGGSGRVAARHRPGAAGCGRAAVRRGDRSGAHTRRGRRFALRDPRAVRDRAVGGMRVPRAMAYLGCAVTAASPDHSLPQPLERRRQHA